MRGPGINTPGDLAARCTVHRNGCWTWKGAKDANGKPSFWFPPLQARVSLGMAACWWAVGRRPEKGEAWHIRCTTPDCANPEHRVCGNRSSQMLAARLERTLEQRLRQAAGRRKAGKLTDADVAAIKASDEPLEVLSARHGISVGYACSVRSGKARAFAIADGVKATEAKSPPARYSGDNVPSIFGPVGHYLPADTAVARAYGGSL